jgi:outer membrane cobalamin receptor
MNNQLLACWATFSVLLAGHAQQQPKDTMAMQLLDEVVVSDSRFALKREFSGKTVIRIGPGELQRNQGRTLAALLNSKSGIEINGSRGRQGEVMGVFARGGRGRQVLVIIDGIRITDPSSSSQEYDLRLPDLSQIESIEIIKGASSVLYGTNAATAVVSITTKKAGTAASAPTRLQRNKITRFLLSGTTQKWVAASVFSITMPGFPRPIPNTFHHLLPWQTKRTRFLTLMPASTLDFNYQKGFRCGFLEINRGSGPGMTNLSG